ncbi:MAG: glycoside hydrolase [Halobacteriales archaeon]|nr:glycoside hydrolase [Halobacteriales archaeon]
MTVPSASVWLPTPALELDPDERDADEHYAPALPASVGAPSAAPAWPEPRRALDGFVTRDEWLVADPTGGEPDIAVDPTDASRIEVTTYGPSFRSADSGASWALSTAPTFGDDNVEADRAGRFLALTGEVGGIPPRNLELYASTDHGATFALLSRPQDATTLWRLPNGTSYRACGPTVLYDYAKLTVDPASDRIFITSTTQLNVSGQCSMIIQTFIRSLDGGATWQDPQAVPDATTRFEDLSVAADGSVFLAIRGSANVCAGISVWLYTSDNVFHETCQAAALAPGRVWVAADPGNASRVWAAFESLVAGVRHIDATSSTDRGQTWSAPVAVDGTRDTNNEYPVLVASAGRLDVAYQRHPNPTTTTLADVMLVSSADHGASWGAPVQLTLRAAKSAPVAGNDYFGMAAAGAHTYVAYAQDRDGDGHWELYVATVTYP